MLKPTQILAGLALIATAQFAAAGDAEDLNKLIDGRMSGAKAEVVVNDHSVERIRKSMEEKMPEVKIGAISKTPYAGMYEVVANGINIFYTDEKGEAGFFGNLVDLKTKNNLTQQRTAQIRAIDFSSLPLDKAFVRVKGNGSRKLALFSDPECPYCQDLEKELKDIDDVTIYTFLLPLTSLHPGAERKADLVWCASDRAKAWDDLMLEKKEPAPGNAKCETPIRDIAELAEKISISGTPGMIFANGKLVPGMLPRQQIEKLLN